MDIKACEVCGKPISNGVAEYSKRNMDHELCAACQIEVRIGHISDQDIKDKKVTDRMDMIEDQKFSWGEAH